MLLFFRERSDWRNCPRRTSSLKSRATRVSICSVLLHCLVGLSVSSSPVQASARSTNPSQVSTGPRMMVSTATEKEKKNSMPAPFYEALRKALKKRKLTVESICPIGDVVARRILEEYGAMFLAVKKVTPPPACVFTTEEEVTRFQDAVGFTTETIADA